ncbi:MAG: hypothetical protein MK110_04550 [Fuerstiella sp.]|nr:hypothetical protein [Fuerstiella sp.]
MDACCYKWIESYGTVDTITRDDITLKQHVLQAAVDRRGQYAHVDFVRTTESVLDGR